MSALMSLRSSARRTIDWVSLPSRARKAWFAGQFRGLNADPGIEASLDAAAQWMKRAQDMSASHDGGVARDFSLIKGWATSYPETTGYIVPTMLRYADLRNDDDARMRAGKMLDWFKAIQLPGGGFQGGRIDSTPIVPVTFNTGQILIGLAYGVEAFGSAYADAMHRAANWLVDTQDADGCWRNHPTPFAAAGLKTYETHVAWGLLEAFRVSGEKKYLRAAQANMRWALSYQQPNGWMAECCLSEPERPLTHTLGYALRGFLEAHRIEADDEFLATARRLADGLLRSIDGNGFLPGRLKSDWSPAVSWACLTGTVQVAYCWMMLFGMTGEAEYKEAAFHANSFVRRTIVMDGDPDVLGGVLGSFPVYGDYGQYEYLNWACKFYMDAQMLEGKIRGIWG